MIRVLVALVVVASMGCATTPLGQAVQGTAAGAIILSAGVSGAIGTVAGGVTAGVVADQTNTDVPDTVYLGVAGGAIASGLLLVIGGNMLNHNAQALDDYVRKTSEVDRVQFDRISQQPSPAPTKPKSRTPEAVDDGETTERSVEGVN